MKNFTLTIIAGMTILIGINSNAQNISTIAGDGTAAYNGDGIAATTAEINNATGVAVDKNGNVYIADNLNNRVRKVDASTGFISTVAGTGVAGYNGDGILATSAELNQPWNLSLDTAGNIYIADWASSRIRKVTISTGMISTVAGTGTAGYNGDGILATSAEVNSPAMVITDKTGNIYISDVDNQRIRKIDISTGMISTIAGTGTPGYNGDGITATTAELHNPNTICLDTTGNLYIADYYNNEIRKVTVSTGIITAVAGNGTPGYNGDGIVATTAELYYPTAMAIDKNENIFIVDYNNNRIRKVKASTGIITTVAGDGTAGYNGDGIAATSAEINLPWGIALGNNAFYIADWKGFRIRKVTISTTGIEQVSNEVYANVYPNPASQIVNIQLEGTSGKTSFTFFNVIGQQVLQEYSSEKNTNISVAELPSGVYFLKIQTQDGKVVTQKVSVIK